MALENFRFRAVIDWIEVRVTLPSPSQARHIRSRIQDAWGRNVYVHPVLKIQGENALSFVFRVQDPASPAHVQNLLDQINISTTYLEVLAVELALDAYPKGSATHQELGAAAFHLHAHQKSPPHGAARLTPSAAAGWAVAVPSSMKVLEGLVSGYTVNQGETREGREEPFAARWYIKAHDTLPHGPPHTPLPTAEHRVRMEALLQGTLCPFRTLSSWATFRFETLTHHFAQVKRKPTRADLPVESQKMLELIQGSGLGHRLGRPRDPRKAEQHRKQGLRIVEADSALNKRIYDALRGLTSATKRQPN